MFQIKDYEFWFVIGSQYLYGEEMLELVDQYVKSICEGFSGVFFRYKIMYKFVVILFEIIRQFLREVEYSEICVGIIIWMYIFFFVKMWIEGFFFY